MKLSLMVLVILILIDWTIFNHVYAHGHKHHNHDTYSETINPAPLFTGLGRNDLLEATATAGAMGAHKFDYSTQDWQGSVVGTWNLNNSANAVSFGVAKRYDRFAKVLMHTSYTENNDDRWLLVGGTFRF